MAKQSLLTEAKANKKDEFYTQLKDIEKELAFYKEHFKNKTIYCNCDDPTKSNFVKYFLLNFKELEIKKIYATSFSQTGHGLFFEYEGEPGIQVVLEDILRHTRELDGNGDFRSDECQRIMDDSDIIVTNPPFSLFREFFSNLIRKEKQFLIIGNVNSITYKEVFATLKDNRVWLGTGLGRWISGFIVPEHYDMYGTETELNENGEKIIATNDCLWLTNLDHKKRHEFIKLEKNYNPND
ncbi:MAG: adenine-specific methyltransferase EcoRI family protein, partial [Fibrobacteraceae bacterium]|nr:adenine-specific methyltransferase EcoRI family protein [Fibrobacteraceae bacterium]